MVRQARHLVTLWAACAAVLLLVSVPYALGAPNAVTAPVRTVRVPWGRIGYRVLGQGRPLVLVTGYSDSIDDWAPRFLDALARHHRVFAVDNEGVGETTLRPGGMSVGRMADDVAGFISALRLRRPDLLGWSMGGDIAQALAVRHPRALRRLVLAATLPGDGTAVPSSRLRTSPPFANFFPPDQDPARVAFISDIHRYAGFYMASASVAQMQGSASQDWLDGSDPAGHLARRIRVPVLIGDGVDDQIDPAVNSRSLARDIPHAQLHLYPDAAHGFWFQDANDWVRRVDRFLR